MNTVDKVSFETTWGYSDLYTVAINNGEWKWYYMQPVTSASYTTTASSHLWMYFFGMYDTSSLNKINQPYAYGGVSDTALADLIESFNTYGAYVFSVNQSQFRVETNGYNMAVNIPLNPAYTGLTSGMSAITLYSSFLYTEGCLSKDTNSLCSGAKIDMVTNDPSRYYERFGIGYAYQEGTNPDTTNKNYPYFQSKIVPLFADAIYYSFTGVTGTSTSWSTAFGNQNKYGRYNAKLASFASGYNNPKSWTGPNATKAYDRIVGLYRVDSGMGILFSPEIVNALDTSSFTGNFITGATPLYTGNTFMVAGDVDRSTQLRINITIPSDSPNSTSNPSYVGQNSNCVLAMDKICLMDGSGNLIGVAQFDEAIPLGGKVQPLEFTLPVDGGINTDGVYNRGIINPSFSS
jgi:hypothetical protein